MENYKLPSSPEIEKAVLGCMIVDKLALATGLEKLNGDDFSRVDNRTIFFAIEQVNRSNKILDIDIISENLKEKEMFFRVGGETYLAEIIKKGNRPYNIETYIETLKDRTRRRKLIIASDKINDLAMDLTNENVLNDAEEEIFSIVDKREYSGLLSVSGKIGEVVEEIEKISQNPELLNGLKTGFTLIDNKTNGLKPGELVLLAARPSMGKSALALNIAQYAAIKENKHVCMFSLEMDIKQLIYRMISSEKLLPLKNITRADFSEEYWKKFMDGVSTLGDINLFIDDTSGISLMDLKNKLRRQVLEHGKVDLVVIDYLQLMDGGKSENRQVEISKISRGLKAVAKEFDCPVLALSQLSRSPESRGNKRPVLSDLRESGAIEQDADIVMMIYRDDYYNEDSAKKNVSEIIIAKQRNGETGTVELAWLGEFTKFGNLAKPDKDF
ncbi:MAG: replicative DNA helicase [Clostridiales bacterium]|nr:MAG: replicative DNA helicase [Clostridiales bacterium]